MLEEAATFAVRGLIAPCLAAVWLLLFRTPRDTWWKCKTFWVGLALISVGGLRRGLHILGHRPTLVDLSLVGLTIVAASVAAALLLWLTRLRARFRVKVSPRGVALLLGIGAALLAIASGLAIFDHCPVTADENAFMFQAKLLASGKLWADSPPHHDFYPMLMTVHDGRWYSRYFLGHQLLLCIGLVLGSPYVITVLLCSLTALTVYCIGREIVDERVGRCAGALTLISPYFIFNFGTRLSHTSSMLFMALFVLFYIRAVKHTRGLLAASLAGASLGVALNIRPYTAFVMSLPFVAHSFVLTFQDWRKLKRFVVLTAAFAVFIGVFCGYNYLITGDPLLTPFEKYAPSELPGFHRVSTAEKNHSIVVGVKACLRNINDVDNWLLGVPVASLLSLLALRRRSVWPWLLLGSYVSLAAGYVLFWYPGIQYAGPTYHSDAIPLLLVVAGCGAAELIRMARRVPGRVLRPLCVATGAVCLAIYCNFFVSRVAFVGSGTRVFRDLRRAEESLGGRPSLIFVGQLPSAHEPLRRQYVVNSPFLDTPTIHALNLGDRNAELIACYPEREAYRYDLRAGEERGTLRRLTVATADQLACDAGRSGARLP